LRQGLVLAAGVPAAAADVVALIGPQSA